jgi:hypothetical protein
LPAGPAWLDILHGDAELQAMRLDLSSPFALAASLLEQVESDDCMDLRFDPVYTGNVVDTNWFGGWGYLPIAGRSTGDLIAMYAVPGIPLSRWRVVELPHNGEGGNSYATSIHSFPSIFVAHSGMHFSEDLELEKKVFRTLADICGDPNIDRVFAAAAEPDFLERPDAELQRLAEGDTALTRFYETYRAVYTAESPNPAAVWEAFIARDPDVACAWHLLFGALRKGTDKKRTAEVAYAICAQDYMSDNYWAFPACRAHGFHCSEDISDEAYDFLFEEDVSMEAARYLVTEAKDQYRSSLIWPAIEGLAADGLVGDTWLKCAEALEADKKFKEAYFAYHTANRHYSSETEESEPRTHQGALRCARALGDQNVVELLEALEEESEEASEDSDE